MIGVKKNKHTNFLGQKSTTAHYIIGNKFKNSDNMPHSNVQSDQVYENKNMELNHPTGLKHNKSIYKKSYLEKRS
jgi:hypothetical protein